MSIGERLKLKFLPVPNTKCDECKKHREIEVDISQATVTFPEGHERKVKLTEKIGLMLKDPEAKIMHEFESARKSNDLSDLLRIIWKCVDYVYDEDTLTSSKDVPLEDGVKFLESLKSVQFKEIEHFFKTLPKLHLKVPIKCTKCDFEDTYVLDKLDDFFA